VGIALAFLVSVLVHTLWGEIGVWWQILLYLVFPVALCLIGSGAYPGSEGERQQQASRSALQFMIQLIVTLLARNYIGSFDAIGPQWFRARADNAGNVSVDVPAEEPSFKLSFMQLCIHVINYKRNTVLKTSLTLTHKLYLMIPISNNRKQMNQAISMY
jgi:hypothetical protein